MNVEIDCVLQSKKKMMKEWFFLEGKGESRGKNSFLSFLLWDLCLVEDVLG